jgi:hypothetical protein
LEAVLRWRNTMHLHWWVDGHLEGMQLSKVSLSGGHLSGERRAKRCWARYWRLTWMHIMRQHLPWTHLQLHLHRLHRRRLARGSTRLN